MVQQEGHELGIVVYTTLDGVANIVLEAAVQGDGAGLDNLQLFCSPSNGTGNGPPYKDNAVWSGRAH